MIMQLQPSIKMDGSSIQASMYQSVHEEQLWMQYKHQPMFQEPK